MNEPTPEPLPPDPATTLTAKLHSAADRELKLRVTKASDTFRRAVNGSAHLSIRRGDADVNLCDVMSSLSNAIVTALTCSNRKAAVDAFIAKVESLDAQVEELRDSINQ